MLKLMDKHTIIKLRREGHSNRETANLLNIRKLKQVHKNIYSL